MNEEAEVCSFLHVHEDTVAEVREKLPDENTLQGLSELFKMLGDATRIKILYVLFEA